MMTRPTSANTNKAIPNVYHSELDCTSSTVIDPEMASDFNDSKSNFMRDFNLYRYYLSQYPDLFSSHNVPSPPLTSSYHNNPASGEENVASMLQSYQTGNTSSVYLSSLDRDKTASKLFKLSPHRSKVKLCKRSNTETVDSNSNRCCFLCRCSNRNQSDSSLWSLSEPDLSQMARDHYDSKSAILADNSNTLTVGGYDERYSHLSRVITPPNAFLNNTSANLTTNELSQVNEYFCPKSSHEPVSYSNKVTQTDSNFGLNKHPKVSNIKLQRYLSHSEPQQSSHLNPHWQSVGSVGRASVESEHIYHSILEQSIQQACKYNKNASKQKGKVLEENNKLLSRARSLKLEEIKQKQMELLKNGSFRQSPNKVHDLRLNSFPPMAKTIGKVIPNASAQTAAVLGLSGAVLEPVHRLTNDGIPCNCNRCRESWGLNLTTELLPLDTQIPLQSISMETMENMDSLLQDNVMTFDICTIL